MQSDSAVHISDEAAVMTTGARFSKIGYVALNVTDLARSRHFYETLLGLEVSDTGPDGELFLRCNEDHHCAILYPSKVPGLKRIGFELESEGDLDRLVSRLRQNSISVDELDSAECARLRQGRSFRITEPNTGARLEFYASMDRLAEKPFVPTVAKIQRLGHVVLACANQAATVKFFQDMFGFKISDMIEGRTIFMRCFPNPYHHGIAFGNNTRNALHHVNFMVSEIDDIGKGFWRFQNNGVPIAYGPGRHPPSGSVFLYMLDPDEVRVEYSFGMEEFPEHGAREPRVLPAVQASSDSWGAPHPTSRLLDIERTE